MDSHIIIEYVKPAVVHELGARLAQLSADNGEQQGSARDIPGYLSSVDPDDEYAVILSLPLDKETTFDDVEKGKAILETIIRIEPFPEKLSEPTIRDDGGLAVWNEDGSKNWIFGFKDIYQGI
ncbi:MAG: hypothetical protein GY861_27495 [bacterium]|nr:hypothetical protein [bacterium]